MVLLAKRVRASTVASISISVSSASLQRMMRSARCSSSEAVKRAPLGWFEDCGAEAFRGCLVADFFLVRFIFLVLRHAANGALKCAATKSTATPGAQARLSMLPATSQRRLRL